MKSIILNIHLNLFIAGSLMLVSVPVLSLNSDSQQPIHISSTQQVVDMATNTVTLIGDVVIKRGSIDIRANKVIISHPDGRDGNEIMEGYGNPVTFYQLQDNGKPVYGHAQIARYETANDLVILIGNAYLEQMNSNISGDRITYLTKKQYVEAFSNKGKQVITILVPAQIQNRNSYKALGQVAQ